MFQTTSDTRRIFRPLFAFLAQDQAHDSSPCCKCIDQNKSSQSNNFYCYFPIASTITTHIFILAFLILIFTNIPLFPHLITPHYLSNWYRSPPNFFRLYLLEDDILKSYDHSLLYRISTFLSNQRVASFEPSGPSQYIIDYTRLTAHILRRATRCRAFKEFLVFNS